MSLHIGVYYCLFLLNGSLFEHVHVVTLIILRCWLTLVTSMVFRWHLVMATKCFCSAFTYFVLLDFSCLGRRQKNNKITDCHNSRKSYCDKRERNLKDNKVAPNLEDCVAVLVWEKSRLLLDTARIDYYDKENGN